MRKYVVDCQASNSPIQDDQGRGDVGEIPLVQELERISRNKIYRFWRVFVNRISYRINHPWDLALHVKWYQLTNLSEGAGWLGNELGKEASLCEEWVVFWWSLHKEPQDLIDCQCTRYHDTASTITCKWKSVLNFIQVYWHECECNCL